MATNKEPTPAEVAELKSTHGADRIYVMDLDDQETAVVFKRPSRGVWSTFVDRVGPDDSAGPMLDLVRACVVWPAAGELMELIGEYPGIVQTITKQIRLKAGAAEGKAARRL